MKFTSPSILTSLAAAVSFIIPTLSAPLPSNPQDLGARADWYIKERHEAGAHDDLQSRADWYIKERAEADDDNDLQTRADWYIKERAKPDNDNEIQARADWYINNRAEANDDSDIQARADWYIKERHEPEADQIHDDAPLRERSTFIPEDFMKEKRQPANPYPHDTLGKRVRYDWLESDSQRYSDAYKYGVREDGESDRSASE